MNNEINETEAEKPFVFERKVDARLILSIIAAGIMSMCGVIVETSMNITFPTLMKEFSVDTSTVQWITTGYLLVLAIVMPASAFLGKRFRMKRLFITSVILFIAGTVTCAVAPVFSVLLAGRLIQGVGTGIALPLMYNIVLQQAPYEKMGMMMGVAMLIPGVAPAVGPSMGGLIVTYLGWRMIFVILLPFLVLALITGAICIRQSVPVEKPGFDRAGLVILGCSFTFLLFGLNLAGIYGWVSVPFVLMMAGFAAMLILFARHEGRSANPIIHLDIFRNRKFTFALCGFTLVQFICLGIGFLIPNFSQIVHGSTALVAGCILLPGCMLGAALSPVSGRILDRKGAALPLLTGAVCFVISGLLFCLMVKNASTFTLILIYMVFTLGQGLTMGNAMTYGLSGLPENRSAEGNSVFNTLQQLFGAIGTVVASAVVADAQSSAASLRAGTVTGTQQAFVILAVLSVLEMVFMVFAVRSARARQAKSSSCKSSAVGQEQ